MSKERYVFHISPDVAEALRNVLNREKKVRRSVSMSEIADSALRKHLKAELKTLQATA